MCVVLVAGSGDGVSNEHATMKRVDGCLLFL